MSTTQIILLALGAVLLFWVVGAYNRMVRMRNEIGNAFAQIDVQLKRRHDLIPNLVEVARKYLEHERETLERVTAARAQDGEIRCFPAVEMVFDPRANLIDAHISRLRAKVDRGFDTDLIHTIRGVGYVLKDHR